MTMRTYRFRKEPSEPLTVIKKSDSKIQRIFSYLQATVFLVAIFLILIMPNSFFIFRGKGFLIFNSGSIIMAGFAWVFFAWSRCVEKDKDSHKRIYGSSKIAFFGAIAFLMTSVFAQFAVSIYRSLLFGDHISKVLSEVFYIGGSLMFAGGILTFLIMLFRFFYEVFISKRNINEQSST